MRRVIDAVHSAIERERYGPLSNMRRRISRGRLTAGFVAFVVAALAVLPFLIFEDPYGEVPIPGSATVHLPAGEVDVTCAPRGLSVTRRYRHCRYAFPGPTGQRGPK